MARMPIRESGTMNAMDPQRYGELTDEFEQMYSSEGSVADGTVIVCGRYLEHCVEEMFRYLISPN